LADGTQSDATEVELPAQGYPSSEQAVRNWFRGRFGCDPTELELGITIGAMARREATMARDGPDTWITSPAHTPRVHD